MKKGGFLYHLSYTSKQILMYVIAMTIPLAVSVTLFYRFSQKNLNEKTYDYLENLSAVTLSITEKAVQNVEDISFYMAGNEQLQMILDRETNENREAQYRQYTDGRNLLSYYVMMSSEISSAYVLTKEERLIGFTKLRNVPPKEDMQKMPEGWNLLDGKLYFKKEIHSYKDQSDLGNLVLLVNAPVFYNIVKDIFEGAEGEVFLIDEENTIIAGRQSQMTGETLDAEYLQAEENPGHLTTLRIQGQARGRYISKKTHNAWRIILTLPEEYYTRDIKALRNFMLLVGALTELAVIVIIIFVGNRMTRSLKQLSQAMEQVGQGDFEVIAPVSSGDEIGVLSDTFNHMVSDMRMLIDNVYRQEMLKQEVEMRSLQMQINPHFLYNTLDTINWMARMKGVNEVGEMTTALGSLMRYSLSPKDFVTIREELNHLKNYISIQNVRYGDRMEIRFDIEESTLDYYIPKLLVQPILENSIVHGIEDKIDPSLILIRSYKEEDNLYIVVEDDGVGMTQEAIESLIRADADRPKKGHTSIGVYNVNRRIQAVFGRGCGHDRGTG